jgi:hypothetical protein
MVGKTSDWTEELGRFFWLGWVTRHGAECALSYELPPDVGTQLFAEMAQRLGLRVVERGPTVPDRASPDDGLPPQGIACMDLTKLEFLILNHVRIRRTRLVKRVLSFCTSPLTGSDRRA